MSPRRWPKRVLAAGVALAVVVRVAPASAAPQWNVGLLPGLAWERDAQGDLVGFSGGVTADVLFGQQGAGEFGIGPALDVTSFAFRDLRLAPSLAVLLPMDPLRVGFRAGPQLQALHGATEPALFARSFIGIRPFNYTASYSTAFGLSLGVDQSLAASRGTWSVLLHLDGMWISLPALVLISWIRGAPSEE